MKWTLWPYQKRACRKVVDAFEGKVNNTRFTKLLVQGATGCGKTVISAALMEYWVKRGGIPRCLFLADMDQLTKQTLRSVSAATGIIPDLDQAGDKASKLASIVVGSIQTLQSDRRMMRWDQNHFGLVIADEAHMSMAPTWQKVLGYFHRGGAHILGVTATPERGDQKSLMKFYEHVADEIPMAELIREKHLSPIIVETVPLKITINSAITDAAENHALAAELSQYYQAIITAWEKHAGDRKKTLWFHPSVAASKHFTQLLMERGHAAGHVDGESTDQDQMLEAFDMGRIRHMNNCQKLTKGYDSKGIDCVVILRPTRHRTPYIQMVGRGTRLYCPHGCTQWCDHPDRKQNMLLLDFLWQCAGHDIMGPADLITDAPEQREEVKKKLKAGGQLDILETDQMVTGEREADLLEALKRQAGKQGSKVDALQFAALMDQPRLLDYEPRARWEAEPPTEAQLAVLARWEVDPGTVRFKGQASEMIEAMDKRREAGLANIKQVVELIRGGEVNARKMSFHDAADALGQTPPATDKQIAFLQRKGITIPPGLTIREASRMMDEIFQHR